VSQPVAVRPVLAVSVALFRGDGHVLIATRTAPPAEGAWSLPGGRLEPGETLAAGALRELEEEVGVQGEIIGFNRHVERFERDASGALTHHFVVASFVARWTGGTPTPGPEAGDVRWVAPGGLAGLTVTQGLGDVLRAAHGIWQRQTQAGA
jgi:8-oxo-dGTP diphosphatase